MAIDILSYAGPFPVAGAYDYDSTLDETSPTPDHTLVAAKELVPIVDRPAYSRYLTISQTETTPTYRYFGGLDYAGNWKINRYLRSDLTTIVSATEVNNGGTTDLATAWTNRASLTYA